MFGVTLDEDTHIYTSAEGLVLPSVSAIKKPLEDFSGIDPRVLEKAANYGRALHKVSELDLAGILDVGSLDDALRPGYDAWLDFKDSQYGEMLKGTLIVERPMRHKRLKYAGTPDIINLSKRIIIDVKSRKVDPLLDDIQTAAYEAMVQQEHPGGYERWILSIDWRGSWRIQRLAARAGSWSKFRFLLDHHYNYQTIKSWR